ncbi:transcription antitermination factor NusB [Companilactobacillus metriopterae]|uniref:transcription antitermination factor NusB n=1 Tax=Companilactobacillus metriopterae TaxID=1909267 RepID=UPI00100A6758|nr:transcription antitermination factor NusB [Companilactobacillus metriopterae]
MNRHKIRELAVQAVFSMETTEEDSSVAIETVMDMSDEADEKIPSYLDFLVNGTIDKKDELDSEISKYLKDKWTVKRLSRIDLAILRVGLFEMENSLEVPKKVAINEAIEIAGEYSDKDSKSFVNGILSNFVEG